MPAFSGVGLPILVEVGSGLLILGLGGCWLLLAFLVILSLHLLVLVVQNMDTTSSETLSRRTCGSMNTMLQGGCRGSRT